MMARLILLIALLPFSLLAGVDLRRSFADLVDVVNPAIVNIATEKTMSLKKSNIPNNYPFEEFKEFFNNMAPLMRDEDSYKFISLGSGFIIDKSGIIVTNNHLITSREDELVGDISIILHDGRTLKAKLLGADESTDLAVLKVDTKEDLPFLEFGNSDEARVGDVVLAIGNAFGLGTSVTSGVVSARSRHITIGGRKRGIDFIQTDAAINHANSGGPLFNLDCKVIGINFALMSPSGTSAGVGFAIPANVAVSVVDHLAKGEKIKHPYIQSKNG